MRQSRRQFIAGTAAVTTGLVAGCLGTTNAETPGSTETEPVQASFFVLSDFASHVAGDALTVENLVPFGQHGHGWEPGPDVQRRVFDATAFVYMGQGFQPWADNIVQNVRADDAGVAVIEARRGVDLLDGDGDAHDHDGGENEDGHEDEHDEHDEHESKDEHDEHESKDEHDADTHTEDDHDEHESKDEHDADTHTGADPHFWLDPARATVAVENIAQGLAEVDGANEETYTQNAAAFGDRLAALDDTYRERLSDRTRDTVLVAGHNSFQYLGRRYGFQVEALTGLAPDAEPTPRDVRRAQQVIDDHDIEYILAPVFESDRAARQLVTETSAVEALPLTPVPSLTEEWAEQGWGYVDVMERVNLPSLAKALGTE
jgi:zinc transport system substrate-binding protein